jgi:hypothetical protein
VCNDQEAIDRELLLAFYSQYTRIEFCCRYVGLKFKEEVVNCYIWSIVLYGAETFDASKSSSEIPGKP